MGKWNNKSFNLTEADVRYVMSCTNSNRHAASFLRMDIDTWKKYASMYMDSESGKNLYELHMNSHGIGISKRGSVKTPKETIEQILQKNPKGKIGYKTLKRILIRDGIKPECCALCSFDERRITDYTVPLVLVFIDGDKLNTTIENMQLICFNCFYLTIGNLSTKNELYDRRQFIGY